jgi:hypothetical protein
LPSFKSSRPANNWINLLKEARKYFKPEAVDEVLAELRSMFYPHHWSIISRAQTLLVMFLPCKQSTVLNVLPEIFEIWEFIQNSTVWDIQFMYIISEIAKNHRNAVDDRLDFLFSIGFRFMEIPVGTNSVNPRKMDLPSSVSVLAQKLDKTEVFAKTIIEMLHGGNARNVFEKLRQLISGIETFFYPSNSGKWSITLTSFVNQLTIALLDRVIEEREKKGENLFTPELIRSFVEIILPVSLLALFGKDSITTTYASSIMRSLSWLDPSFVLPKLLETVLPDLENVTEVKYPFPSNEDTQNNVYY